MKPSIVRILHLAAMTGVVAILLSPLVGCHRTFGEMPVRVGMTAERAMIPEGHTAPEWVTGPLPYSDDEVYFVGRSVCYTVLDEHAAVDAARENVLEQFSQLISTRVTTRAHQVDARANAETSFVKRGVNGITCLDDHRFIRFLPGPELAQAIARDAAIFSSGVAGDLALRDVYFEQWDVREEPIGTFGRASRGPIRYKCWVLMSIPREKLEQRIQDFRQLVKDAYERYVVDRERAIAWAEQDRERRIHREEENRAWAREDQLADRDEARGLRHRIMSANAGTMFQVSGKH